MSSKIERRRTSLQTKGMKLLNCTLCDDVIRVTTILRHCECQASSAIEGPDGIKKDGPCRLLGIPWEEYDGAYPGAVRKFHVLPK